MSVTQFNDATIRSHSLISADRLYMSCPFLSRCFPERLSDEPRIFNSSRAIRSDRLPGKLFCSPCQRSQQPLNVSKWPLLWNRL